MSANDKASMSQIVAPTLLLEVQRRAFSRMLDCIDPSQWQTLVRQCRSTMGAEVATTKEQLLVVATELHRHGGACELLGRLLKLRALVLGAQFAP